MEHIWKFQQLIKIIFTWTPVGENMLLCYLCFGSDTLAQHMLLTLSDEKTQVKGMVFPRGCGICCKIELFQLATKIKP